jgi:hypothetical protein
MDWAASDREPPPRAEPAAPTLLGECWRLVGPSKNPIMCGIYADGGPGVELRVDYTDNDDDIVRTQRVHDPVAARELAEQWRQLALAKGFSEIPATPLAADTDLQA